jgi:hypothetical protein
MFKWSHPGREDLSISVHARLYEFEEASALFSCQQSVCPQDMVDNPALDSPLQVPDFFMLFFDSLMIGRRRFQKSINSICFNLIS